MVLVIMLGAESWEPSTANTGIPASLRRRRLDIADSKVEFVGRACSKMSPARIMKSGFSSIVLSTSSENTFSKSFRRASRLY